MIHKGVTVRVSKKPKEASTLGFDSSWGVKHSFVIAVCLRVYMIPPFPAISVELLGCITGCIRDGRLLRGLGFTKNCRMQHKRKTAEAVVVPASVDPAWT